MWPVVVLYSTQLLFTVTHVTVGVLDVRGVRGPEQAKVLRGLFASQRWKRRLEGAQLSAAAGRVAVLSRTASVQTHPFGRTRVWACAQLAARTSLMISVEDLARHGLALLGWREAERRLEKATRGALHLVRVRVRVRVSERRLENATRGALHPSRAAPWRRLGSLAPG